MAFVLDASVAAAWFLPDEANHFADGLAADLASNSAHVPSIFWCEMRSLLLVAERRGRIALHLAEASMDRLRRLPISAEADDADRSILDLARRHRLSTYDAAYLELALRRSMPLASVDAALVAAARIEGIEVLA